MFWAWLVKRWRARQARRVMGTANDPRLNIDRRPITSEGFRED